MRNEDLIRLRHMLEAAQEAMRFAEGKSRSDLDNDRMLSLALVRLVEIVGEAASHVSEDCKDRLPQVPMISRYLCAPFPTHRVTRLPGSLPKHGAIHRPS
jgi:uncharacterized protein with HEPN domain